MREALFDREFLKTYLKDCRSQRTAATPRQPLSSIVLIGGLNESDNRLSSSDFYSLVDIFKTCAQEAIPIADDVRVDLINLAYNDEDFLETPPQANIVAFCNIFYDPRRIGRYRFANTRQSPHADNPVRWHDALLKSEAQLVFNFPMIGDQAALPAKLLSNNPFSYQYGRRATGPQTWMDFIKR